MNPRAILAVPLLAALGFASGWASASASPAWDPWTPAAAAPKTPDSGIPCETNAGRIAGLALIRVYQLALSPGLRVECQFAPSCSRFAARCVAGHGLLNGIWMGADRVSRCHGFAPLGGYSVSASGALVDPASDYASPVPLLEALGL